MNFLNSNSAKSKYLPVQRQLINTEMEHVLIKISDLCRDFEISRERKWFNTENYRRECMR